MFFWQRKKEKIGLLTAVSFAVGAMIGGGVFVLSGVALNEAGPSALISFIIAGIVVLLSAFSFAVVASMAPARDSGYDYIGKLLSPVWAFLTSWCFYLAGIIGAAFVLNAFGIYMHDFVASGVSILAWGLIGALVLTLLNLGPASEIGRVETFLVAGKLLVLLLLIGFGIAHFNFSMLHPFTPHGATQTLTTSASLFIAFLGFNVITSISGDIHQPRKTVPRAILLSMLIVTVVYVGVVIAMLAGGVHNYSEASVGVAAQHLIGPVGGGLVVAGALVATLSAANANILGSSEIMLRLAARKEVPTILGRLYNGHPYASVLLGAVFYALLVMTGKSTLVIGLANTTAIFALIIVNMAAAKALSSKHHKGMRLPFGYLLPLLGTAGAVWQLWYITESTLLLGGALVIVGLLVYLARERYFLPREHKEIVGTVSEVEGPLGRTLKR